MAVKKVVSPLPGLFYRRPLPESPVFKDVGDGVEEGDVIGLVEVMKSFHEIKADISGTVVKFLVENEGAVMVGQPLLEVEEA